MRRAGPPPCPQLPAPGPQGPAGQGPAARPVPQGRAAPLTRGHAGPYSARHRPDPATLNTDERFRSRQDVLRRPPESALRQTDSRFAQVTRHDATGSSRRRTTLSAKGDSRRSWSDNGFHGRYVSAGEVEPGFHVEPEPSVGLMLQSWEIGMTPPRGPRTRDSPPSKPPSQTRAPWPATARRIATYHPYGSTRYAQSSARSPHASPACCHPKCPPGADSSPCPARHAWLPYPSPRAISGLSRGMGDERPSQWRLTRCQAPRRGSGPWCCIGRRRVTSSAMIRRV